MSDSDSESSDDLPALLERRESDTDDGSGSSSSDEDVENTGGRDDSVSSAEIPDSDDSSNVSIPELLPRAGSSDESDSDEQSSHEEFPDLTMRRAESSDDESSDGNVMPDLTTPYDINGSDNDSSVPELMHKESFESEVDDESSSGYESESNNEVNSGAQNMPPLLRLDKINRLRAQGSKMKVKDLKKKIKNLGTDITGLSEKSDLALAYAKAVALRESATGENSECDSLPDLSKTQPQKKTATDESRKAIAAEKTKHANKKPGELRRLLKEEFDIKDQSLKSKADLLDAYAKAVIEQKSRAAKKSQEEHRKQRELENKLTPFGLRKILENRGICTESLCGKKELLEMFFRTAESRRNDEEIEMPPAIDAQDPPKIGAWVLSPKKTGNKQQSMDLTYAFPSGDNIKKTPVYASYRPGSVLVPGPTGSIWVYYPTTDKNDEWALDLVKSVNLKITVCRGLEKYCQLIVHDGKIWALKPSTSSDQSDMVLIELDNKDTLTIHSGVPTDSRLIEDRSGGVWVYVKSAPDFKHLQPGLWHFAITDDGPVKNRVVLDEKCLLSSDSARVGVLILQRQKDGSAMLSHYVGSERKEQKLNVRFDVVQSIVDDGNGGALIHYKDSSEWKLANVTFGSSEIADQKHSCPKNSKLSTNNGMGAVWVLKKAGKKGADRGLQYLNGENTIELSEKYPAGSILAGAME